LPVVFHGWESPLVLPLMLVCGMIGGAAYAAIPAFLKARLNTNEILTSLMLVYVAQLLLDWTVRGPWRNPEGFNFPETRNFAENAILPRIIETGKTHWGFGFALIAALVLWFVMRRTLKGFEITRAWPVGAGRAVCRFLRQEDGLFRVSDLRCPGRPCRYIGSVGRHRPAPSGDFARLRLHAIIVAFLGRLNPLGIVAAGLILALTYLGGEAAQISIGITDKVTRLFQGLLAVLRAGMRHVDPLPHPAGLRVSAEGSTA
jgi:ABC-type uncharacterized transport system permease subunit